RAELVERGRGAADRAALLVAAGRDAPRAGERLVGGAPAGLRRRRAGRDPVPATPAAAARPPLPGRHAARSHPPRLDHCQDGLRASGRRAPAPVPFGAPSSRLWRAAVSPHGRTAPHGASRAYRQSSRASEAVRVHRAAVGIVGAGPTGLFAAYYAGFRGLSSALIDALPEAGGQVSAMYPEKQIFDVAGFPAIRGRDLVANLVQQAAPFRPTYLLGRAATELSYEDGRPVLGLDNGERVHCQAVIITSGIGRFTPRPLPAAASFDGEGVVYFVPRLEDLAGHHVVIVGGGDSAFDWALA